MVDSLEAVSRESGDYIQGESLLRGKVVEIGEVIERGIKVRRPSIFKTVGVAIQDNLASYYAIRET